MSLSDGGDERCKRSLSGRVAPGAGAARVADDDEGGKKDGAVRLLLGRLGVGVCSWEMSEWR